jgi:hypothetical protein
MVYPTLVKEGESSNDANQKLTVQGMFPVIPSVSYGFEF